MLPVEDGQFYKVVLDPGEGFSINGTTLGHPSRAPYTEIHVYDAAFSNPERLWFGSGSQTFTTSSFVNNTPERADFYVRISCKYNPLHDFSMDFVFEDPGPNSVLTKISAFIPEEWIANPADATRIFEGDNRSFEATDVSSRLVTLYAVANPAIQDQLVVSGPDHGVGLSIEYDSATSLDAQGHVTEAAKAEWILGPPLKTDWAVDDQPAMYCDVPPGTPGPATVAFYCSARRTSHSSASRQT